MNILLTFDIEIWCNGWKSLDADFPAAFQRYVYGRSPAGDYALPKTLEILNRHELKGVFFVEPLFAARFGVEHLAEITKLITDAGQEVQLHLHPEWTDEIRPRLIPDSDRKRQHLSYYSLDEQRALIGHGLRLMREAGIEGINAFRAGSFACNADTFQALQDQGICFDSSINATYAVSAPDIQASQPRYAPFHINSLGVYPVSIFRDGFGHLRHAQVGACSAKELEEALQHAHAQGAGSFVILSHNFEMLKSRKTLPDSIVVNRFERLCAFLAGHRGQYRAIGFHEPGLGSLDNETDSRLPQASLLATATRYAEQLTRRLS